MRTERSIYRTFSHYVSLNVLSMIGLSCYILADTYFISSGIGSMGIAALNIVLPVYSLISGIGLMLGMGAATRYSILRGEGQSRDADEIFTGAMRLGAAFGVLFTVAGIFFAEDLAALLGAGGDVLPLAGTYLKTILMFSSAFVVNQIFVCFVRNDSQPKLAMLAMLVGSFSNVILDYIFVFPLRMGMFGAALATGLAPIFSMLVLSTHYFKKGNRFHFVKCPVLLDRARRILSLGVPAFITEFSSGLVMLIFNFIILDLAGSKGVAAYGIIANLALVVVAVFTGIAQGIQPIISVNLGLGDKGNIKKVFALAMALSLAAGILFYTVGLCFSGPIVEIFNGGRDAMLAEMAGHGLRLYFIAFLVMGVNITASAYFAALSKPFPSFIISITRGCAAVIPLAFLLSRLYQMTGVWLVIPCVEVLTALISVFFCIRDAKAQRHGL